MGKAKKLKKFYQRKLRYESKNDNFISKKESYHLGVSHESVFGEIITNIITNCRNMFKAHEDNKLNI